VTGEARYWAVDDASVPVAERRGSGRLSLVAGEVLVAPLSLAGAVTITMRVDVLERPTFERSHQFGHFLLDVIFVVTDLSQRPFPSAFSKI
jgi:hypothetical protein